MDWLSLDDLLEDAKRPINFDQPPEGPNMGLSESLVLIKRDLSKLETAFSGDELVSTRTRLMDIRRQVNEAYSISK